MACTIEVENRQKGEDFELKDLRLSHKECYGGKIEVRVEQTDNSVLPLHWEIRVRCLRCGLCVALPDSLRQEIRAALVKTAIDGETRSFKDKKDGELLIVQGARPSD